MDEPLTDLFGLQVLIEAPLTGPRKRPPTKANGYAAPPGSGPEGETCKSCVHLYRNEYAKVYLKCDLMRAYWTGGTATDIRAGSPACSRWSPA